MVLALIELFETNLNHAWSIILSNIAQKPSMSLRYWEGDIPVMPLNVFENE